MGGVVDKEGLVDALGCVEYLSADRDATARIRHVLATDIHVR